MKAACKKRFEPVLQEIDQIMNTRKDILIVAIDGKCASGKTTLAHYLQQIYDCNVYCMDDFFLREEQKTVERINEIGGNIDYERFRTEVINKILKKQDVEYRKYSCEKKRIEKNAEYKEHKRLNIVEGSYSQHPYFGEVYDLKIFMNMDSKFQIEIIKKRDGEEKLKQFREEWIPKENAYFKQFHIKENSMVIRRDHEA